MAQQTQLDSLLIGETELNREQLTEVLEPYVRIGDESGAFVPRREEFDGLGASAQVAVVLLYRRAASELGLAEGESASPKEIAEISGVNHNTVKTAVRDLEDSGVAVNEGGEYHVPPYAFEDVRRLLGDDDG